MQELGSSLSSGSISGGHIANVGSTTDVVQEDIIEIIANLATVLSYFTRPTQNKSILPLDIGNTNNILSSLLM